MLLLLLNKEAIDLRLSYASEIGLNIRLNSQLIPQAARKPLAASDMEAIPTPDPSQRSMASSRPKNGSHRDWGRGTSGPLGHVPGPGS